MKSKYALAFMVALMAAPTIALADFNLAELPQAVQDRAPTWIFQILSILLNTLVDGLLAGLLGAA
jgi:hypothetical protein